MGAVIPTWRDANNNDVHLRAGFALAANPFPSERSTAYAVATGLAASTSVTHTTTHNPGNGQYNSINLGLFVDLPRGERARRVYAEWDVNAPPDVNHWFQVVVGVWNANTSQFITPLKLVLASRRSINIGGGHDTAFFGIFAMGNNNGESVQSHAAAEITVVIPPSWYDLVASNPDAYLRFIMGLRNASATAITVEWRAMFTVFGF